jgi:hypothetical protein
MISDNFAVAASLSSESKDLDDADFELEVGRRGIRRFVVWDVLLVVERTCSQRSS